MIDLRDSILRFRMGASIKRIHRETGRHKTMLRRLLRVARENGCLAAESPLINCVRDRNKKPAA